MMGFPLGLLYSNAWEWVIHKHVLHGLARDRESFWAFHWYEHHRNARREEMCDGTYRRSVWGLHAQGKEALGLLLGAAVHLPLARRFPWFTAAVWCSQAGYYWVHRRSHEDPEWAKRWVPWHYDHHMGPDQHSNWCVTFPLCDWVMGTRKPWLGTPEEREHRRVREAQRARRAMRAARCGDETLPVENA